MEGEFRHPDVDGTLSDAVEAVHRALDNRSPDAGVAAIESFQERLRALDHTLADGLVDDLARLGAALSAPTIDGRAVGRMLLELARKTERELDHAGPAGQPLAHLCAVLAHSGAELAAGH